MWQMAASLLHPHLCKDPVTLQCPFWKWPYQSGIWTPIKHKRVCLPKGIMIGSAAILAQLTCVPNTHTDHTTCDVQQGPIYALHMNDEVIQSKSQTSDSLKNQHGNCKFHIMNLVAAIPRHLNWLDRNFICKTVLWSSLPKLQFYWCTVLPETANMKTNGKADKNGEIKITDFSDKLIS